MPTIYARGLTRAGHENGDSHDLAAIAQPTLRVRISHHLRYGPAPARRSPQGYYGPIRHLSHTGLDIVGRRASGIVCKRTCSEETPWTS